LFLTLLLASFFLSSLLTYIIFLFLLSFPYSLSVFLSSSYLPLFLLSSYILHVYILFFILLPLIFARFSFSFLHSSLSLFLSHLLSVSSYTTTPRYASCS
jgi:hypothetical protein